MMKQPEVPALTVENLKTWLRQQPSDGEYVWSDPVYCLVGRYLADNGSEWGAAQYSDIPGYEQIAGEKPWTYGAALARAEALALPAPERETLWDTVGGPPKTLELTAERSELLPLQQADQVLEETSHIEVPEKLAIENHAG